MRAATGDEVMPCQHPDHVPAIHLLDRPNDTVCGGAGAEDCTNRTTVFPKKVTCVWCRR